MKLPFLKNSKWPRSAPPPEEKLVNGSSSDHIEDHCFRELSEAIANKDVNMFRHALEALVMNCFETEGESDATTAG